MNNIKELEQQIQLADQAYYGADAPIMTDANYDALVKEFEALGGVRGIGQQDLTKSRFLKISHAVPMLSLDNIMNDQELVTFNEKINRFLSLPLDTVHRWLVEPKMDGLSVNLTYRKGHLQTAATRGDGLIGEDIIKNVQTITAIPNQLKGNAPDFLEVRGEIFIRKSDFLKLNALQQAAGKPTFANPRNAAAGSVRHLDSTITQSRPLNFIAWGVGEVGDFNPITQTSLMKALQDFGFPINPLSQTMMGNKIDAFYTEINQIRATLDYDIDGLVLKLDDRILQQRLGYSARAPRFAVAYKFPAEEAITRIKEIQIQVGRIGSLTPVAILEPVNVGGVIVTRATLHNEDEIARLDARVGDIVTVERAGDVIPKILRIDTTARSANSNPFIYPNTCPVCGHLALRPEGQAIRRCTGGMLCAAQVTARLVHFISKDAFDIVGLGEKQVEGLWRDNLIKTPVDYFSLETRQHLGEIDLYTREGWGKKSVDNLFQHIRNRRVISLSRFIYALGIPGVGETTAKLLAKQVGTAKHLLEVFDQAQDPQHAAYLDLLSLDGIGHLTLTGIRAWWNDAQQQTWVRQLVEILEIEPSSNVIQEGVLSGKTIAFTGTLTSMGRVEAKTRAEQLGATVHATVSKKTNILVVGMDAGSKAEKARALGVEIWNEEKWKSTQAG
jgi:DNA ligase (NAD+)